MGSIAKIYKGRFLKISQYPCHVEIESHGDIFFIDDERSDFKECSFPLEDRLPRFIFTHSFHFYSAD